MKKPLWPFLSNGNGAKAIVGVGFHPVAYRLRKTVNYVRMSDVEAIVLNSKVTYFAPSRVKA